MFLYVLFYGAMTHCLSGFTARGVCSEILLRDLKIMKVPLKKNINRNLGVLDPPTQGLCLFISELFLQLIVRLQRFIHFSGVFFTTVHCMHCTSIYTPEGTEEVNLVTMSLNCQLTL